MIYSGTMDGMHFGVVIVIAIVVLALLVLFVAAIVSILRSPLLSGDGRALWIVIVVVFQFVGPLAWFLFGRNLRLSV